MGAQIIIDARKRQVRATLEAPGEGTTIFAVDLIGDTWEDFAYFAEQATHYEKDADLRLRNRYVRAAIAALFSHLDGVASELFEYLRKGPAFGPYLPKRPDFCSLKNKVVAVARFLERERNIALPSLNLDMKLLRDILNHPSITKQSVSSASIDTLLYDGADVYGVDIRELARTGSIIDEWLNAACLAIGYERFRDTKRACEEFARALGGKSVSTSEF